jgi:hypothetical protein
VNTYPCPGDPLQICTDAGGTWLPIILGAIGFACWLGYRFGRYGGSRRHERIDN